MRALRVEGLPADPLAAAAAFYAQWLGQLPSREGEDVAIVFPPADHTHRGWRLAVVQGLARAHAPLRVNAVASDSSTAIAAALAYLEAAPGLTGQLLTLDDAGAGVVIDCPA